MITLSALHERDGGICHLCRKPVQLGLPAKDPRRATRDHIQPKSAGGAGTQENIRLAHAVCNEKRGCMRVERYQSRVAAKRDKLRDWTKEMGARRERRQAILENIRGAA